MQIRAIPMPNLCIGAGTPATAGNHPKLDEDT